MEQLKDVGGEIIQANLEQSLFARDSASPTDLELTQGLTRLFAGAGAAAEPNAGAVDGVLIRRFAEHPDLIVAALTLGLPCEADDTLYFFRRVDRAFRRIMVVRAIPQSHVHYAISPADTDGTFFVAVASMNASCSSSWRTLKLRVLKPRADSERPTAAIAEDAPARLDAPVTVTATRDAAAFEFLGGAMGATSAQVRRFSRQGERFVQDAP